MIRKRSKLSVIKKLTEYGIHIWAILIIANAMLVYAYHFSTQAAQTNINVTKEVSIAEDNNDDPNKRVPVLDISFTIPGIGSGGGTLKPKRSIRSLSVFLYAPDANSLNQNVKPLYTINGTATYDSNPASPTYTAYVNHSFPLGKDVKDGNYQILFRTDESLRAIVKERPEDVGGKLFDVNTYSTIPIPLHSVQMGDTIPKEGDNKIDISDYNAFINCYGDKNTSDFCQKSNYGDFDDNGVVDGVDYNILARTFRVLIQQGQSIPQVTQVPSPKPISPTRNQIRQTNQTTKPTTKPKTSASPTKTPTSQQSQQSGGSLLFGILFIFLILGVLGVLAFLYFKNVTFKNKVLTLLHKTPVQTDDTSNATEPTSEQSGESAISAQPAPKTSDIASETEIQPADIAKSSEIPLPQPTPDGTQPTPPLPANAPVSPPVATPSTTAQSPTAENKESAKSYYVKKKLPDDQKTGFWLVLTDDNGAIDAHYTGADVNDGFALVKGMMKEENGKKFLEVTQLTPEG